MDLCLYFLYILLDLHAVIDTIDDHILLPRLENLIGIKRKS